MRVSIALLVGLLPLVAADQPAKAAPVRTSKSAPKAVEIPAGAVQTEPGSWRYTDAQGKKWLYRKTPFGVARLEDKDEAAAGQAKAKAEAVEAEKVKVSEDGDTVRFERPGPFGIYKWERKTSELSDDERGWLEKERTRRSARAQGKQE